MCLAAHFTELLCPLPLQAEYGDIERINAWALSAPTVSSSTFQRFGTLRTFAIYACRRSSPDVPRDQSK